MNVLALIQELRKLDPRKEVYLSSDPEGNSYGSVEGDSISDNENSVVIYPFREYVEAEEIFTEKELNGEEEE